MPLPKSGLGGFNERIFSWKQGVKQQMFGCREKVPRRRPVGRGNRLLVRWLNTSPRVIWSEARTHCREHLHRQG